MIADAREMSMVCENRLFIVDARASADTFRRSLKCEKCALTALLSRPLHSPTPVPVRSPASAWRRGTAMDSPESPPRQQPPTARKPLVDAGLNSA